MDLYDPYDEDEGASFGAGSIPNLGAPQFVAKAAPVGTATGAQAMLPNAAASRAQAAREDTVAALRLAVANAGLGSFTSSPAGKALYVDLKPGPDQLVIDSTIKWAGNALQTANLAASLGRIWSKAAAAAPPGSNSTSGVLVGAVTKFGMSELTNVLSTLVSDIITLIAELLAEEAAITVGTAATIGSIGGYIGELAGLIVGACVAAVNMISGGPSVQITNGKTYSAKDYASTNLQNAITWFQSANAGQIMSLTPKCVADTFGLFLANPVWMYQNQKALGISQPPPPDYDKGTMLDVVYQQLPGAFELVNRIQFLLAASMVLTSPSQLPFFAAQLSDPNATKNSVDQTIAHYHPYFTTTLSTGSVNAGVKSTAVPGWAPGVTDMTNVGGSIYAGCPNLFTNDNAIKPSGQGIAATAPGLGTALATIPTPNTFATPVIAGQQPITTGEFSGRFPVVITQTAPATNAFLLQHLFPALSTYQCQELFSAAFPLYNSAIAKVRTWIQAQPACPTATTLQQFNLTDADVAGAIALWHVLHPTSAPASTPAKPALAPLPAGVHLPPAVHAALTQALAYVPPRASASPPKRGVVVAGVSIACAALAVFGIRAHRARRL